MSIILKLSAIQHKMMGCMPVVWSQSLDLCAEYDRKKGFWRKLFCSSSDFMRFLEDRASGRNPKNIIHAVHCLDLIRHAWNIPQAGHGRLSHRLAQRIVSICAEETHPIGSVYLDAVHVLEQHRVLNVDIFQKIMRNAKRDRLAQELLACCPQYDAICLHKALHRAFLRFSEYEMILSDFFCDLKQWNLAQMWCKQAIASYKKPEHRMALAEILKQSSSNRFAICDAYIQAAPYAPAENALKQEAQQSVEVAAYIAQHHKKHHQSDLGRYCERLALEQGHIPSILKRIPKTDHAVVQKFLDMLKKINAVSPQSIHYLIKNTQRALFAQAILNFLNANELQSTHIKSAFYKIPKNSSLVEYEMQLCDFFTHLQRFDLAKSWCQKAVTKYQDPKDMMTLANLYQKDRMRPNVKKACDLYFAAWKHGHAPATDALIQEAQKSALVAHEIASRFQEHHHVQEAQRYHDVAAQKGHLESIQWCITQAQTNQKKWCYLIMGARAQDQWCLEQLHTAAQREPEAQYILANFYGDSKKYPEAVDWAMQAAENAHSAAYIYLCTDAGLLSFYDARPEIRTEVLITLERLSVQHVQSIRTHYASLFKRHVDSMVRTPHTTKNTLFEQPQINQSVVVSAFIQQY